MISASTAYLNALNATSKAPIYQVVLTPVDAPEPEYSFCTSHTKSGEDLGIEILVPLELDRRAEPEECRFALSTLTFELQDHNEQATAIVNGLVGYRCVLYAGFWDLVWNASPVNYVTLFTGIVTEMSQADRTYKFTARSPMSAANDKTLFSGAATKLIDAVNTSVTTLHVQDASEFEAAYPPFGGDGVRVIQVGDGDTMQMYAYTGQAPQIDGTWNLTGLGRSGSFGFFVPPQTPGVSKSHEARASIYEIPYIGDFDEDIDFHPANIFRNVLSRDTGKRGIAEAGIVANDSQLDDVIAELPADIQFRFLFKEPVTVKKFLEDEICLVLAGYPTESAAGAIGIKLFPSNIASTVDTIEDADIIRRPKWLRNSQRTVTTVVYHFDYMPATKEYLATYTYRDDALIAAIGHEIVLEIFSRGLRSPIPDPGSAAIFYEGTPEFLTNRATAYVNRFKQAAPIMMVEALWTKSLLELADDVGTSFNDVPNIATGAVGVTNAPSEVIATRHRFADGIVEIEFMAIPPVTVGLAPHTDWAITSTPTVS